MYCLWDGEYGDHDLSFVPSLETTLKIQDEQYNHYIGCEVGDFTCLKVEYDWGRRDQRWTIKCKLCGELSYQYHAKDWRRGKGRKTTCHCRKEREIRDKLDKKRERLQKIEENKKERFGKTYGCWKIVEYGGNISCVVQCVECGKKRRTNINSVIEETEPPCQHIKEKRKYGDEWIGKRNGHLTAIDRVGCDFLVKCDCGNEEIVSSTYLFTYKIKTHCSSKDCPYCVDFKRVALERREKGLLYEKEVTDLLVKYGYNAKKTQDTADFGVDVIIYNDDGSKTAIQCKNQGQPAGVNAVQEVYAGGRYYDCEKFAIMCKSGFSNAAIKMARKLGVYLCDGDYKYPDDLHKYCVSLLPVVVSRQPKRRKEYEIKGERHTLAEWCAIYGKTQYEVKKAMGKGVGIETALHCDIETKENPQYTAFGVTGTLKSVCAAFGVESATVAYRMRKKGMTLEEAIKSPKLTDGRPRKK